MILGRKLLFSGRGLVRRFSSQAPFQEVSIPIPWGEIRGKWWGPTDVRPILTVHGWQDNCGSFDRLLPLLSKNVAFLAIDLPGHGFSSRLPVGVYYDLSTYNLTLQYIVKYFQWPKVSLMGHSLGGITAYTYTMLFPHDVDFTICLDGGKPLIVRERIPLIAKNLKDFVKYNDYAMSAQEPPSYSLEQMKQLVHAPNQGSVELQYTPFLMYRNIAASLQHPGKYYFTRDPRLRLGTLMGFPQEEIVSHSQHITSPIFLSKSTLGRYYEEKEHFYEVLDVLRASSRECAFHYVEGTHHAHLNNPEVLSQLVDGFIQRHTTEERREGGIRREIWVTEDQDPRVGRSSVCI